MPLRSKPASGKSLFVAVLTVGTNGDMSNRPWMPFYIGDYLADTGHLRTVDHGAYILLLLHYWRTGSLPQDDTQLAKIARLPLRSWKNSVKPILQPLFRDGLRHKRVEKELAKHAEISRKRSVAGQKGALKLALTTISKVGNGLESLHMASANPRQTESNHNHNSNTRGESERVAPPKEAFEGELAEIIRQKGWLP